MPDQFDFLSLEAFKKLTTNERQAYLQKIARYVGALEDNHDDQTDSEENSLKRSV